MHNCTIGWRGDMGRVMSQMVLGDHQDSRGGVWATYALPVGIVAAHRSQWLQGEANFTWRLQRVGKTPTHRFFQISQSPFLALWRKYNAKQRSKD